MSKDSDRSKKRDNNSKRSNRSKSNDRGNILNAANHLNDNKFDHGKRIKGQNKSDSSRSTQNNHIILPQVYGG